MSETLRIKVIDAMSQGRKIHIDQIEAVEALIEQEVEKGKIDAYEDCGSQGGNGKVVRDYAKSRAFGLQSKQEWVNRG